MQHCLRKFCAEIREESLKQINVNKMLPIGRCFLKFLSEEAQTLGSQNSKNNDCTLKTYPHSLIIYFKFYCPKKEPTAKGGSKTCQVSSLQFSSSFLPLPLTAGSIEQLGVWFLLKGAVTFYTAS